MAPSVFVGIDPGISGAIAILTPKRAKVFAMPTDWMVVNGKRRRRINKTRLAVLWDLEVMPFDKDQVFVCVEKLQPIGSMGAPKRKKGGKGRGKKAAANQLSQMLFATAPDDFQPAAVAAEEESSSGGQGFAVATTNFQLGRSLGQIDMLIAMSDVKHDEVPWKTWSAAYGIKKKDKDLSLKLARQMFPKIDLHLKEDHNKAEALLLAHFGRLMKGAF